MIPWCLREYSINAWHLLRTDYKVACTTGQRDMLNPEELLSMHLGVHMSSFTVLIYIRGPEDVGQLPQRRSPAKPLHITYPRPHHHQTSQPPATKRDDAKGTRRKNSRKLRPELSLCSTRLYAANDSQAEVLWLF
jgi:hypothetical protein